MIDVFLSAFNVLADKFMDEDALLKNISIVESDDNDEDFKVELGSLKIKDNEYI